MSLYQDIQKLLKTSENSVETAKAAIETIRRLHIRYCELFRNDIDNLWGESDGRRKMCSMFVEATDPFNAIVEFDRQQKKAEKVKAKRNG